MPTIKISLLSFIFAFILVGCAVPITTNTKYPIDVFYEQDVPDRPYSELRWIELSNEDALKFVQTKEEKRLLNQGNSAQTKSLLTAQLVQQAQKLGADALVNVRYQYYAGKGYEGYSLRGLAVRYRGY